MFGSKRFLGLVRGPTYQLFVSKAVKLDIGTRYCELGESAGIPSFTIGLGFTVGMPTAWF